MNACLETEMLPFPVDLEAPFPRPQIQKQVVESFFSPRAHLSPELSLALRPERFWGICCLLYQVELFTARDQEGASSPQHRRPWEQPGLGLELLEADAENTGFISVPHRAGESAPARLLGLLQVSQSEFLGMRLRNQCMCYPPRKFWFSWFGLYWFL